jgi:hypothetical protein
LCEGADVFKYVFGLDVDVHMTPKTLTVKTWGDNAESTDPY